MNGVIAGVVISNQSALELRSENGGGHIAGPGSVNMEEAEIRGARIPEIGGFSIEPPPSLVAMSNICRMYLAAECFVMRFGSLGDGVGERHGGGGNKGHGKDVTEKATDIAERQLERMPEENGGGLGDRSDLAVPKFTLGGLVDIAATCRTEGHVVNVPYHMWTGLQDDVFLNLFMVLAGRDQAGCVAMWADIRGGGVNRFIDVIGHPAKPRRMPFGCAPFPGRVSARRRRTVGLEA